ncbi:neural cell adhesion molecule L1-like [Morone saxatilis]|uniref:neural cell adhesion molecule L1-like n=1 Tax=Morone saxatilis TaxID=34816 RepID=UPI0015E2285F|nr:neural cell adhesion molecule L1-like [Morone saxatilis]
MCVSQRRWTGYRGPCSPALPLIFLLLLPLSFLSSTPPFAQGAIQIPENYKVQNMSQPPVLTETPISYTAFSQEDIHLPCEASGNPKPTYRWMKDGLVFGSERNDSGTLRAEGDELLTQYEGYYRCYASNMLGTAVTQTVRVIVEHGMGETLYPLVPEHNLTPFTFKLALIGLLPIHRERRHPAASTATHITPNPCWQVEEGTLRFDFGSSHNNPHPLDLQGVRSSPVAVLSSSLFSIRG